MPAVREEEGDKSKEGTGDQEGKTPVKCTEKK
jgi:hypothetical protein